MFYLIPQALIVLSLGGILFIFLRKIIKASPSISEKSEEHKQKKNKKKIFKKAFSFIKKIIKFILKFFIKFSKIIKNILTNALKDLFGAFRRIQSRMQTAAEKSKKKKLKKQKEESSVHVMIAEKECINRIAKDPKDVEAYLSLGRIYKKQKHFKDAKACFEHVLKIKPKNKKALKEVGKIKQE